MRTFWFTWRVMLMQAGGSFTAALQDLVDVDFVEKYAPLTVKDPRRSRGVRYTIVDEYLHFYYRLIDKKIWAIDAGKFKSNPAGALRIEDFNKLMGYAFERWCRKNEALIAARMGFAGVVDYNYGAWFERSSAQADGFQIDLMFIRKDSKIVLCEIKYNVGTPVPRDVASDVETKRKRFMERNPKFRNYTLDTALITVEPVPDRRHYENYFHYLIAADDLFAVAGRR